MPVAAPVRVRFAPSPTGYFHVGGARTALFNWLFARHHGGTMVLRIEDTDVERNQEEWVVGIVDALRWLDLDWDEGPYRQSERSHLYAEAAEKLHADGRAYYCDCVRAAVEERTRGRTPGYDGFCRDRGLGPGEGRALRFRAPDEGSTTVVDVIRGAPVFDHATVEDFVILRSNGTPVFILAVVVDDMAMAITHVIRGEEHLPNTVKTLLLWEALGGGDPPVFAHVPVLVNQARQKLSKRRDKVALEQYREQGYLPEAMRNYLGLLGWAPPDGREVVSLEQMVAAFRLEDVNSSPAFFDERKLLHFNAEYIRGLSCEEFINASGPFLERGSWASGDFDLATFEALAPLVQERVRTLGEVPGMVEFLFLAQPHIDEKAWDKRVVRGPAAREILSAGLEAYGSCPWTADSLHDVTASIGERHQLSLAKAQFPVRVAVTGRDVGPPLFESLEVLGRDRTRERLRQALARLEV
ncbi:MAG: glutamate--tRNA ligase [Actinomycetota bacterium]|nr:glutamate--tRNA ligase [Actinomycetota bacterium]MDQ3575546.1 glutamate--tRNA ligase [Actinomycetota bacterium]